jgi:hypothetical protein
VNYFTNILRYFSLHQSIAQTRRRDKAGSPRDDDGGRQGGQPVERKKAGRRSAGLRGPDANERYLVRRGKFKAGSALRAAPAYVALRSLIPMGSAASERSADA